MAPPLSKALRDRVVVWHQKNPDWTYRFLAELAGCSIGTISNILKYQSLYGQSTNPFGHRLGRQPFLDQPDLDFLQNLLDEEPCLYLDEIHSRLIHERGIDVSFATIWRALLRLAITNKAVSKESAERNDLLRATWQGDMAQYDDPSVFMFLDESAVDNRTPQRSMGWSLRGQPCTRRATFLRGTRYSILPALTVDGIVALDIFEGSVTREKFVMFLQEQIMPQLNPFRADSPAKRSIVVMDNCSIHHDEEIRRLIEDECGALLIYLPPYSPDFNPIEEAFSAVKAWLRRHEDEFDSPEKLPWLIHRAMAGISTMDAFGWFSDCGYIPE